MSDTENTNEVPGKAKASDLFGERKTQSGRGRAAGERTDEVKGRVALIGKKVATKAAAGRVLLVPERYKVDGENAAILAEPPAHVVKMDGLSTAQVKSAAILYCEDNPGATWAVRSGLVMVAAAE